MHTVYVVCLFGGALTTSLFAILGRVGGHAGAHAHGVGGHVGAHAHVAGGHTHVTASHPAHGSPVTAHGHAGHGTAPGTHAQHGAAGGPGAQSSGAVPAAPASHAWLSASLGWTASWLSPLTLAAGVMWFGAAGLVTEGVLGILAVVIAVLAGIAGAAVIRALMMAFMRASTPPLQLGAEGALGTVNAAIRSDGPGEVIYTLEGLHRSIPAYSEDGRPIPRGTTVVILRKERGFAWVEALDPLSELEESHQSSVLSSRLSVLGYDSVSAEREPKTEDRKPKTED